MPRYIYQCGKCNQSFEVEKSVSLSGQAEACPRCGTIGNRVFTAPAIAHNSGQDHFEPSESGGCSGCCQNGMCGK
jgi:putative FmdB family regulatory protein